MGDLHRSMGGSMGGANIWYHPRNCLKCCWYMKINILMGCMGVREGGMRTKHYKIIIYCCSTCITN